VFGSDAFLLQDSPLKSPSSPTNRTRCISCVFPVESK
jgi:hypothetical protein